MLNILYYSNDIARYLMLIFEPWLDTGNGDQRKFSLLGFKYIRTSQKYTRRRLSLALVEAEKTHQRLLILVA
jgi:hypothetical protein